MLCVFSERPITSTARVLLYMKEKFGLSKCGPSAVWAGEVASPKMRHFMALVSATPAAAGHAAEIPRLLSLCWRGNSWITFPLFRSALQVLSFQHS